jgi:hypothetical protein
VTAGSKIGSHRQVDLDEARWVKQIRDPVGSICNVAFVQPFSASIAIVSLGFVAFLGDLFTDGHCTPVGCRLHKTMLLSRNNAGRVLQSTDCDRNSVGAIVDGTNRASAFRTMTALRLV